MEDGELVRNPQPTVDEIREAARLEVLEDGLMKMKMWMHQNRRIVEEWPAQEWHGHVE